MNILLSFFIITSLFVIVYLSFKLFIVKKSLKEIRLDLRKILKTDTNNLINTSSSDKEVSNLSNDLNVELMSLRKQRLEYENGNQELKQAITNISHDLRTPLTGINGYVDLLKEEELTEKQYRYVQKINDKTTELINLTEQLFDYSRSLDLEKRICKKSYCINEILEETIGEYYKLFQEHNINPDIKICEKQIYKNVDKTMIIRIFENLISNIIRYSDNDCNIELKDGKIIFFNKSSKLDATTVRKIFDRYYTVDDISKNSGVGLSITKQLVEINGGSILAKYLKDTLYIVIELD